MSVKIAADDSKTTETKPVKVEQAPQKRKKKSSAVGDGMFIAFLAGFGGLMKLSFEDKIPYEKWEIMSLEEHIKSAHKLAEYFWVPIVLSVLYVFFCFYGERVMKNHPGFDKELRMPLAIWSLILAVFSIVGSLRTVPIVFKLVAERGVMHLVCGDTRFEWLTNTPAGFWTYLFCLSKVPELIDTAFIILRKKELITLHWYHHFTVMLFCWQAWATCTLNGLIFAAMNLTVHAIMYTFYALTALGYRPTTFALFITLGQISQMVVGTAVTAYVTMDKLVWHPIDKFDFSMKVPAWFSLKEAQPDGGECFVSSGNALAGLIMYGSYLGFFVEFFYQAYCAKGAKGE